MIIRSNRSFRPLAVLLRLPLNVFNLGKGRDNCQYKAYRQCRSHIKTQASIDPYLRDTDSRNLNFNQKVRRNKRTNLNHGSGWFYRTKKFAVGAPHLFHREISTTKMRVLITSSSLKPAWFITPLIFQNESCLFVEVTFTHKPALPIYCHSAGNLS